MESGNHNSKASSVPGPLAGLEPPKPALELHSGLLSAALGAVSDGVIVVDVRESEQPIIFVNDAFVRLTGYTAEEAIGRNCRFLQGDATDPLTVASIRASIDSGQGCTEVLLNHRKDGSTFFNELTLAPFSVGVAAAPDHFVGILNDVTDRVLSDRTIRGSEERYRSLINAMSEGVVMQAPSGEIIAANPQAEAILGVSEDQLHGLTSVDRDPWCLRPDGSRFPGEEHPAMVSLATGEPVHDVTMGVVHPSGELRWISINSEPVRSGGQDAPIGVVTSFTDITERRRLEREQAALRKVAEAIAAERDDVFAMVAQELGGLTDSEAAAVLRFDGEGGGVLEGVWYSRASKLPIGGTRIDLPEDGEAVKARNQRQTVRSQWGAGSRHRLSSLGFKEAVTTPITVEGSVWGVIGVSTGGDLRIAASAERQLERFSELVALAVSSAHGRAKLAEQADRDPLTGLLNHRVFHERLRAEVARSRRHDRPLSLILVDIDCFKQANDSAGHRLGDEMLQEIGRRLTATARTEDVVARVGGDEFALILPEGTEMDAYALAERVRLAISSSPLAGGLSVTASAGVCGFEHAESDRQIHELADGALYWSKAHGRDQTWIYDPAVVRELSAQEKVEQLHRSQAMVGLRALARAIDAKDQATREHSERVAALAALLAGAAGWSTDQIALLHEAALVHDVGKIGIADEILLKPGRLTPEEYEDVNRHAELSAEIVGGVLLPEQVAWVRSHHERPDGRGCPDGLSADAIPAGAALLATADCFDVMTASRSYSMPMPVEEAIAEVISLRERQFAGFTVDALLTLRDGGQLLPFDRQGSEMVPQAAPTPTAQLD